MYSSSWDSNPGTSGGGNVNERSGDRYADAAFTLPWLLPLLLLLLPLGCQMRLSSCVISAWTLSGVLSTAIQG